MRDKLIQIAKNLDEKTKSIRFAFSVILGLTLIILLIIGRVNLGNQIRNIESALLNLIDQGRSSLTRFEESIPDLETTFTSFYNTLDGLQTSSGKLPQLLDNVGSFLGNDFVSIAVDGKKSLESAASGARIIDDTLSFLSRIPFLNVKYNPKQTLEQGLRQLADNFSAIPPGLEQIEQELQSATKNLESFSEFMQGINSSLGNIENKITGLRSLTSDLRLRLDTLETNLKQTVSNTQRNLTILLIILILLILLWLFNLGINYFAGLTPVSGKISIEQDRADQENPYDEIVPNNK